uniref:RING-type domain-containing protein n=1 Tax=Salix viminalis TaxID=40686 RepID=A0A6N2KXR7_SALVM
MSLLSVLLQEPEIREASTLLALLSDQMEGVDSSRRRSRKMSLKERLGLKGLGCCGATWGFSPTTIVINDDPDTDEEQEEIEAVVNTGQEERNSDPGCLDPNQQHSSGMNLAAALAAERQLRGAGSSIMEPASVIDVGTTNAGLTGTPLRVSLMRLLEESTEGGGGEVVITETTGGGGGVVITETTGGGVGNDTVCCVCMGRKKGAAFIPCGHTFCRVCSRELWLNRGSCPLCNRSILEILDIF